MVYQLATFHKTLEKNTCHNFKYCNLCKAKFKTKCYQGSLASSIKVGHFGCLDVSIIMQDRGRKYGLETNI